MKVTPYLGLLALSLAGCLDDGTAGTVDTDAAYKGIFVAELATLNLGGIRSVIIDAGAGPRASDDGWAQTRALWRPAQEALARIVLPCDVRNNPHRVEAHVVGVYTDVVDDIGAFGETVPEGIPYQDPGVVSFDDVTCVAGEEVYLRFDISLMKPAEQGFFDITVRLDAGDDVKDAVWQLSVVNGDAPPARVWEQDISSSWFGDGAGSASFVGPCDGDPAAADNTLTIALDGVFGTGVSRGTGYFDPIVPTSEPLELWPPPPLSRTERCMKNTDRNLVHELTVARVDRSGDGVAARFAGLTCEAGWTCPEAGVSDLPSLTWSCAGETTPTLLFDDITLTCDGRAPATFDAWGGAELSVSTPPDGPARATWRTELLPPAGPCTLEARATAYPGPEMPLLGSSSWIPPVRHVYPEARWQIPVSTETCTPASLNTGGPITMGYATTDTPSDPGYAHTFEPEPR